MNEDRAGELNYIALLPTGNGWNVEIHRVWTAPKKYYDVSPSTVARLNHIINRDDYDNYHVELGRTGWVEFQLYRDPVLKNPWKSQ